MQHLFSSVVKVSELKLITEKGRPVMRWVTVPGLEAMRCRLDLQFLRPGKDTPSAVVAGAIPDREGIMFCSNDTRLTAGMQIETINDRRGKQVVVGVFEIKEMPDVALDYADAHHIEVKIIETVQQNTAFPDLPEVYEALPVGP